MEECARASWMLVRGAGPEGALARYEGCLRDESGVVRWACGHWHLWRQRALGCARRCQRRRDDGTEI